LRDTTRVSLVSSRSAHPLEETRMTVTKSVVDHGVMYELRDDGGRCCVLAYTADPDEPSVWKILLDAPGDTLDLYGTEQFPDPDATQIEAWLSPFIGDAHAAELAAAVDADPPQSAAWKPRPA
jgi:hypothetical protein